ncbi:Ubiquinol-cytochrome c reductase complex chaperone CBP3-like protein, partial [Operophtera brumata]
MLRSRLLTRVIKEQRLQMRSIDHAAPCMNLFIQNKLPFRQQSTVAVDESYIKKFMKAVGWMDQSRTYDEWFEKLELPDTFASWFIITELHVWMLMVRYMAEDVAVSASEKKKYIKGDGHF